MSSPNFSKKFAQEVDHKKTFDEVFENWLMLQKRSLDELKSVAKSYTVSTHSESTQKISRLVNRVMTHYEAYYQVKSESVNDNVLQMLNPTWISGLEAAFLWIGGWRPSMAIHLVYSITGLQLEARVEDLLKGLHTSNLGELTPSQLGRVNELQGQIVRGERVLTESLAVQQETVADTTMVELSQLAFELTRAESDSERVEAESVGQRIESTLESKENKLMEIVRKADDLRLQTLKNVVGILSPIQAVHFWIAAAELHLKVHEWGIKKDAKACLVSTTLTQKVSC